MRVSKFIFSKVKYSYIDEYIVECTPNIMYKLRIPFFFIQIREKK